LSVDHPIWRGRLGVYSCAVSVLAISIAAVPAAARHATHRGTHGIHQRHKNTNTQTSSPPYADIVLDINSGKILHADKADDLRHPASLTKIMTLYLLFEKLESGKLRLDSQLAVSEHASEQAPTKLGLKPGGTIEVEDAIRGLVTKSANDAAVVVAEAIGGTEHDFAEMMTAKAHALGMTRTVYRNASGLPNDDQVTTARDQATLGRAIQERFPHYYKYFSTPSFTWHGETLRNHNHLLGHIEGMDGIKTGYTQASGYNLVASVRRNDRHIVSVVLGGSSAGSRDARMRSLIEDYIDKAAQKNILVASAAKADAARKEKEKEEARKEEARKEEKRKDDMRLAALVRSATADSLSEQARTRPGDSGAADARPADTHANDAAAPGSGTYAVASAASEPIKPVQVKTLKVKMPPAQVAALAPGAVAVTPPAGAPPASAPPAGIPPASAPPASASPASPPPAAHRDEPKQGGGRDLIAEAIRATVQEAGVPAAEPHAAAGPAPATTTVATATPPPAPAASTPAAPAVHHTGWMIQVGAFDVEQEAHERLAAVQNKVGHLLKHADPFTEAVTSGDKTLYRARFAGMQKDQAEAICKQLKRSDIVCMTIKN
jgi:D-alanyl-D-alanine carboxypeptidase